MASAQRHSLHSTYSYEPSEFDVDDLSASIEFDAEDIASSLSRDIPETTMQAMQRQRSHGLAHAHVPPGRPKTSAGFHSDELGETAEIGAAIDAISDISDESM